MSVPEQLLWSMPSVNPPAIHFHKDTTRWVKGIFTFGDFTVVVVALCPVLVVILICQTRSGWFTVPRENLFTAFHCWDLWSRSLVPRQNVLQASKLVIKHFISQL